MNYHIGNMLIYQEFNDSGVCPLCRIRNILENRLAEQYLNESVMEDFQRRMVNERGFCRHHTDMLYARQNKLSLALQHVTRLTALKGKLEVTADLKTAQKMAETFIHSGDTCVICDNVEVNMIRYYKTVAEMFYAEPKFKEILQKTNGFCMEHFGYLLKYAAYARGKKKDYIYTLTKLQKNRRKSSSPICNGSAQNTITATQTSPERRRHGTAALGTKTARRNRKITAAVCAQSNRICAPYP